MNCYDMTAPDTSVCPGEYVYEFGGYTYCGESCGAGMEVDSRSNGDWCVCQVDHVYDGLGSCTYDEPSSSTCPG